MSNFQKDVQLLADLQGLIEKREKQVNPPEGSTAIMGAISKNRLGELMEGQR